MKILKRVFAVVLVAAVTHAAHGQEPNKAEQETARLDQVRAAVQEICPVSGQKLGSMGAPVKVAVGENKEEIFLCCKGCANKKIDLKHWATIHANFAKAQRICPVMKNELPKGATWTIVEGRIVYVCCPPCIKKIEADPKTYLKAVDELYLASLKKQKESDAKEEHSGHR